jgi:hypothetical protein
MIMKYFVVCFSLCLLGLPSAVLAAPVKDTPPDDRTLVSAIDLNKRTIDFTHQSHKITTTYALASDATIEISGKSVALKDVKIGMELHVIRLGSGMDDPPIIEDLDLMKGGPAPK